jgi:hypothetical protein
MKLIARRDATTSWRGEYNAAPWDGGDCSVRAAAGTTAEREAPGAAVGAAVGAAAAAAAARAARRSAL